MFPRTAHPAVVRTDFDNESAWNAVCSLIRAPVQDHGYTLSTFYAYVDFVELTEYRSFSTAELLVAFPPFPDEYEHSFFLVVDRDALSNPEFPVLVVDLHETRGRTFRTVPTQVQAIQNNLSLANLDFGDFAKAVDQDGVFRGFRP